MGSASASSCTPATKGAPARSSVKAFRHADVWLYGDSITYQTYADLRHRSARRIAVDAWWGRRTAPTVVSLGNDVHRFAEHLPKVVIMATGTNDLTDPAGFAHQVQLARAVLPASVKLIWVNMYADTTPAWNTADRILSGVDGVRVVSWSRANLASQVDGHSSLLLDGVHVNSAGCLAHNALLLNRIG
jgi:hypothetical protein